MVALSGFMVYENSFNPPEDWNSLPIAIKADEIAEGSFVIPPQCLYEMVGVALSGSALLAAVVVVIPELGFTEGGVEAESAAAAWQATMGDVEKESLFATLQSLAARGKLLDILKTGLPVVGNLAATSGAFCSKLKEIESNVAGAEEAIGNMTAVVLAKVECASKNSEVLDQLRDAGERAAKDAAKTVQHAADAVSDFGKKTWDGIGNITSGSSRHRGPGLSAACAPVAAVTTATLLLLQSTR